MHLIHKYGKWEKVRHIACYWDDDLTGMKTEFVRYCETCGKPQTKRVKGEL